MRITRQAIIYSLLSCCFCSSASAQDSIFKLFNNVLREAAAQKARKAWDHISPSEAACMETAFEKRGFSIGKLIRSGIRPNDAAIAAVRQECAGVPRHDEADSLKSLQHLSEKPTFDCSKAKSPTGRIICMDRAGAAADWNMISASWAARFSLPPQDRKRFDDAEEKWLFSLNSSCRLRNGQATFTSQQHRCVLHAYENRVNYYRQQISGDALQESKLSPEDHARLQQALIARGFLQGDADGEFGEETRIAIQKYHPQTSNRLFLSDAERTDLLKTTVPDESDQAAPLDSRHQSEAAAREFYAKQREHWREVDEQTAEKARLAEEQRQAAEQKEREAEERRQEEKAEKARLAEEQKRADEQKEREAAEKRKAERRSAALQKGPAYAANSNVTWSAQEIKNEMTDKVEITVMSTQSNDNGAIASVKGFCADGGTINFTAQFVDSNGVPLPLVNSNGTVVDDLRVNDEPPTKKILATVDYSNVLLIAELRRQQPDNKVVSNLEAYAALMTLGMANLALPLDEVWRIMAEVKTSEGPVLVKIPIFDNAVQKMVKSCQ